ncbi:MAG: glycosyltransferase family 4 protein [Anaerolineae bacterium]
MSHGGIALVVSGFPRRSETFALNELLALEARGMLAAVFATKPGDGQPPHPDCARLLDRVQLLPAGSPAEQAAALVEFLGGRPLAGIHAYFAHTPAEVAAHAARQLNLPYGFSAHARDARKVAPAELARRAREAACVVACNSDVAGEFKKTGAAVHLIPHGVDSRRFYPRPLPPAEPLRLLAVGRLVEKKGFDVLIRAVAQLSVPFHLRIIGDGPERSRLAALIHTHGLTNQVELCGGMTHTELPEAYAAAHVVVVPSIVDRTGDRDGLPNVVLEAMACGRPVVACNVGAIRNAVKSARSGFLVPAGVAPALTYVLEWLAAYPTFCEKLGQNGRAQVERDFELGYCAEQFCRFLGETYNQTYPKKGDSNNGAKGRDWVYPERLSPPV